MKRFRQSVLLFLVPAFLFSACGNKAPGPMEPDKYVEPSNEKAKRVNAPMKPPGKPPEKK